MFLILYFHYIKKCSENNLLFFLILHGLQKYHHSYRNFFLLLPLSNKLRQLNLKEYNLQVLKWEEKAPRRLITVTAQTVLCND